MSPLDRHALTKRRSRTLAHLSTPFALACALAVALVGAPASAQPITYQGVLTDLNGPVFGGFDVRAKLFDAETDGTQIGPTVESNVGVDQHGAFTVPLDFGSAPFAAGQARWLELEVSNPTGSGDFSLLNPRQRIAVTPLAMGLAGVDLTPMSAPVVDVNQTSPSNVYGNVAFYPWQSFTAGVTGTLIGVDVRCSPIGPSGSTGWINVVVHEGEGVAGAVIGSGTASVPYPVPPALATPTTVSLKGIPIEAGKRYTLAFSGPVLIQFASSAVPGTSSAVVPILFRTTAVASGRLNVLATGSYYAGFAQQANSATIAQSATTAENATLAQSALVAQNVPWLGLTGQGEVRTGAIATGWQFLLNNTSQPAFRGGLRLGDTGFLEITNSAVSTSPSFARLNSAGVWTTVSDARLKRDVATLDTADQLDRVLKFRPVAFTWNASGQRDLGVIAQEAREVMPELVTGDESKEMLTVSYAQLSVAAIAAIQEIQRQRAHEAQEHERERAELEARIEALTERLQVLEAQQVRSK